MTTPITTVTIQGTAQVGQTLTADVDPEGATATYEWQRSDASDGSYTAIDAAVNKTYQVQEADSGQYIKVKATGTGAYTGTQTSAATAQVQAAAPASKVSRAKKKV